jgi:hypothetical protein
MTTLQAILLGMTPGLALLAFLLWQDDLVYDEAAGLSASYLPFHPSMKR